MNPIATICGRELKGSLSSPLAHVFMLVFALCGLVLFFWEEGFFAGDQASVRGLMSWMPMLIAIVAPALTMRLWTDERRLGTYELLATLPIRPTELVLGKFLASWALLLIALLFTLGAPLVAASQGDLDWGPVFAGYLGALLVGAAFLSVGLFASSLAKDQFLSLLVGWALCALFLLPDAPFWESVLPAYTDELGRWGFMARFAGMERGVIDLGSVVFYLSFAGLFLWMNTALVSWRRYSA